MVYSHLLKDDTMTGEITVFREDKPCNLLILEILKRPILILPKLSVDLATKLTEP